MIARGTVTAVSEAAIEIVAPALASGCAVRIATPSGMRRGVVVRATGGTARVALAGSHDGIAPGALVEEELLVARMVLGSAALGRAIDAFGNALDGGGELRGRYVTVPAPVIAPVERCAVDRPLWTGVRAIDALLTMGRGARVGIFGLPGAGKSTLLETIVDGLCADAVVLALVGERGREAERWFARCDRRTTVVCATSDRAASERVAAAHTAFAHAHALAKHGMHVAIVLDSLARVAYALREIGIAGGESVGRGGYPASTFASLARLVESAGAFASGSVSLIATVLSDGDDRDPVSEAARSMLDGHLMLSAALAQAGRFPAIDVPASASRTMHDVVTPGHAVAAGAVRRALADLAASHDLRSLGLEPEDAGVQAAVAAEPAIERLLRQGRQPVSSAEALAMLLETADTLGEPHGHRF